MRNSKRTKSALITSMISLVLCFTMLLGTTYAWFTDTASTGVNKIQAGNLDVELWMYVGTNPVVTGAVDGWLNISNNDKPIFGVGAGNIAQDNNLATLWEPGKTQVAYLQIRNTGNLDLKYKVAMDVENVTNNMNNALRYTFVKGVTPSNASAWTTGNEVALGRQIISTPDAGTNPDGVKLSAGESHNFALSVHMQEDAGNEYKNGKAEFDLTVFAAQLNAESDSFGNTYDQNAEYIYEEASTTLDAIANNVYNKLGTTDTARYYTWAEVQEQVGAVAGVSYYAPYKTYDTSAAAPTTLTIKGVEYSTDSTVVISVGNNNFIQDKVFKCENGFVYVASPVAIMEAAGSARALTVTNVAFKGGAGAVTNTGANNYTVTIPDGKTWLGMYYSGAAQGDLAITRKVLTKGSTTTVTYGTTFVEKTADAAGNPLAYYPVGWNADGSIPEGYNGATMQYTVYIANKGLMEFNFTYTVN